MNVLNEYHDASRNVDYHHFRSYFQFRIIGPIYWVLKFGHKEQILFVRCPFVLAVRISLIGFFVIDKSGDYLKRLVETFEDVDKDKTGTITGEGESSATGHVVWVTPNDSSIFRIENLDKQSIK